VQPGKRLLDKVAIVTGGASGIGAETGRVFAMHGATVVLCDVQNEVGRRIAKEIADVGGAAEYRSLDVRTEQQWLALVAETERRHGKTNILGNIVGISGRPA
jgi:NAD(P)-dependent dehydrogenase (short-subunit alcohol dehydrogenase family)